MPDGPVQLVLNSRDFVAARLPAVGGGSGKDFYTGRDDAFEAHRNDLATALERLAVGGMQERVNVLVRMRPDALAKSHRPFGRLFSRTRAAHVGTAAFGELIYACTVRQLVEISDLVRSAEVTVPVARNARGQMRPNPSAQRTEVGAIDSIERWDPAQHRGYSLDEAEDWVQSRSSGGAFTVELLESPTRANLRSRALEEEERLSLLAEVRDRLARLELPSGSSEARLRLPASPGGEGRVPVAGPRDILPLFERSSIVKRVRLQDDLGAIEDFETGRPADQVATPSSEGPVGVVRAVVGVIDGGVGGPLESMVVGRAAVIADEHRSVQGADHASEIASIVKLGSALNPRLLDSSEDCDVYDIRIYPDQPYMPSYFPTLDDFFDQLRSDVERARDDSGVRVFNLSLNLRSAPGAGEYSLAARYLDQIALELDVIFVISAGNLPLIEQRPEWPPADRDALSMLAQVGAPDGVAAPAESLANFAVGAVNPPDLSPEIEGAPTRYSRRGGRVPSAIKPDFATPSGAAPDSARAATGFQGINSFGNVVELRGTSFSAPLVSRYLATLDRTIAGSVSRETLTAMAVHHARLPALLNRGPLRDVAASFVGHGLPSSVEETLEGNPHRMTLVLAETMEPGKRIELPFSWPPSLTGPGGSCRGRVQLTLVTRPALNYVHGHELVRVNLEAALQQAGDDGTFIGRVTATHQFFSGFRYANERTLATELGKWSPIRTYQRTIPRGVGRSADWRLELNYLTRASEALPPRGVPFAVVLTIEDPDQAAPVFDEMRLSLGRTNVQLSDLRTALTVSANA